MDYIKIRFGDDPDTIESKFEKVIEDIFRPSPINPMFISSECMWSPQMDIYETPDEIVILAEIAGVQKEDLDIEINSKAVKIYGHRYQIPRVENTTYRLAEIQYGKFERILFLPTPIDTDKVSASFLDGFLQIRLLKLRMDITYKIPIIDG
ncbi:MAG: Hsp20/alpha crystallin family protein [Desulfobacterales bacterium]|jgi:HSP20 family protein|nr:heat-shock protein Hsp20 [Desulfobacter sp.]MDP6395039.1 Hsp20/alpha crystallin family protein [Desulfobacterales bacterium]MDP6683094.1 Hsp20/alpha crystallin family protein [Desulfobacterales bacterium]MDP6806485.1 Hsp20/alpha crystallin family protein [Desulfobacterales bacterium]|tara:strand:- start:71 stop:523 length:453 start_codon:yes stop_codon:yes gene_type:complete